MSDLEKRQTESQRGKRKAAWSILGFLFTLAIAGWWNEPALEQYKFTLPMALPIVIGLFGIDAYAHYKGSEEKGRD